ncbi:MAG: FAD-dependent oxidoreductase [Lachnoclostridium edouardi]|uniref:oxidoreductase n=1 Tax=Lachnoclostridium edouardi TaxID=1926283 RepID=UPI0026DD4CC9|nr:FAD-dependent oxidoreductase [Lachnoclostridium edouardi]MDO4277259.1 FAD-dependent oxidoreductase [Lachnoclostridium edouardi]
MKKAFTPCRIGACELKYRFVMTAGNLGWCTDGHVSDETVAFYRERAKGGAGLIVAGAAGVDPVRMNRQGMMQVCQDRFIPGLKRLADDVHRHGSKIFLQLMHAGAYAKPEEHGMLQPVSASEYECGFTRARTKELTVEEIHQIEEYFKDGALRAKEAGFDGVEVIASAGYLISEFLSKAVNKRTDEYGGSLENRTRFLEEILQQIKKSAGADYPVMVRLSGADFIPGGNTAKDTVETAKRIERWVDALDVTGGWHESQVPQITYHVPHGAYLFLAKLIKDVVSVPVVGCNRLDMDTAVNAIEAGTIDMAGMLRGFIADPAVVEKYKTGRKAEIRPCLGCNQECLERIFRGGRLGCVVNPLVGREDEKLHTGAKNQQILVVGAGPAGLAFASESAKTNRVTVWERENTYGGMARLIGQMPNREDTQSYLDYLFYMCNKRGVRFVFQKNADPRELLELLESGKFDKVVVASGSLYEREIKREYPVAPDARVLSIRDFFQEKACSDKHMVIIGAGYQAAQIGLTYASRKYREEERRFIGKYAPAYTECVDNIMRREKPEITLITKGKKPGEGFGMTTRWIILKEIKESGIDVKTETEVLRVEKNQVVCKEKGEEIFIPADMVVITGGEKPNPVFHKEIPEALKGRILWIGDAGKTGRISEAVKSAFQTAINQKEDRDV